MVYILNLTLEEYFKPNFMFYLRYEPALEPKNIVFGVFFNSSPTLAPAHI